MAKLKVPAGRIFPMANEICCASAIVAALIQLSGGDRNCQIIKPAMGTESMSIHLPSLITST